MQHLPTRPPRRSYPKLQFAQQHSAWLSCPPEQKIDQPHAAFAHLNQTDTYSVDFSRRQRSNSMPTYKQTPTRQTQKNKCIGHARASGAQPVRTQEKHSQRGRTGKE